MIYNDSDTIVAPATATGGALCLIRISGGQAIAIVDDIFRGKQPLSLVHSHKAVYGNIVENGQVIDDVVATLFRAPNTYTGENIVEISAHGSRYIINRIISAVTSRGARLAEAGEFTRRAYLAGRLDLSQAEAVADIIASESQASHAIASTQMRGGYSDELKAMRHKLINLCSLLELELDFSEEDVEFADRSQLSHLIGVLSDKVNNLLKSFALGNVLKEGVTVAIVGAPNVGKSTLLNHLAGEERAMVSDIAGTTRDTIEVVTNIDGVIFRFIDTAGLHATDDRLEQMGIERTKEAIAKARIVLVMHEATMIDSDATPLDFSPHEHQRIYHVVNKIDLYDNYHAKTADDTLLYISAKSGIGIKELKEQLTEGLDLSAVYRGDTIVSSQRHYQALKQASESLQATLSAIKRGTSADLLSEELRQAMHHIGTITGEISSDDILHNIFSKFCIGK